MSNRIYVRNWQPEMVDQEIPPDEQVTFERNGVPIRVYFDGAGEVRVSADEPVTVNPEASNTFVICPRNPFAKLAARRIREAIDKGDVVDHGDIRTLIEETLR